MTRIIYCTFLQKKTEGLDFQLYPGVIGKRIYDNISKDAWNQWKTKQTILINEQRLNMNNYNHRKIIEKEMILFLFKGNI